MSISHEEARDYLEKVGNRGALTLKVIEALAPYVEAIQSEPGMYFMKADLEAHAKLFNKIYNDIITHGQAEQRDAIHLQILHVRLGETYKKLKEYTDRVGQIKSQIIK